MKGKKLLKNIISTLVMQVLTILCSFIIPSLLIKRYGSNVNGLVTSITQFLAYITLLESGIGPVVKSLLYKPISTKNQKEIENILKASERFFKIISYIFIAYIVVLCVIFPCIMNGQFDIWYTLSLVVIISISTFAEYYFGMTYRLYLQAEQKTYIVSNIQTVTMIMNVIATIFLINNGASIQIVKLISTLIFAMRPILQNVYVKKKYKINLKNVTEKYELKKKWDGLAQHIASVVHTNTDITILTFFADIKEVSVYSVYLLVINGVKKIVMSLVSGLDAFWGEMLAKNEKEKLNRYFSFYEYIYFSIITIIFSCTLVLIIPFIKVYTIGINDISYSRPLFAYILIFAEFVCMIRLPYINLTYAAGHFKETRIGAWVEAITNIVISLIFVNKFGIIGVAIGTLCAMIIRTIEFIYHSSKKILERKLSKIFIQIILILCETTAILFIFRECVNIEITSYFMWIVYAIKVAFVTSLITIPINIIIYFKEFQGILELVKKRFLKRKENLND